MDLAIIIVNWNSRKYLKSCLVSLFNEPGGLEFEVIVIDNASYDGTRELLSTEFPQVQFIQSDANLGFARANNLAAKHVSADTLLFLNPDTEIHRGALERLYRTIHSENHIGVVGARLLNTDGTLQTSCIQAFPTVLNHLLDAEFLRRLFPRSSLWGTTALAEHCTAQVESVSGACLVTTRELFTTVGGFTESYFMYYEDTDYCLKSARAGYRTLYEPRAIVVHHGGKSSGGQFSRFSSVMMAESGELYFRLRHGRAVSAAFRVALGSKSVLRIVCLSSAWPAAKFTGAGELVSNSLRKWICIFQWTIGGQRWASEYKTSRRPESQVRV